MTTTRMRDEDAVFGTPVAPTTYLPMAPPGKPQRNILGTVFDETNGLGWDTWVSIWKQAPKGWLRSVGLDLETPSRLIYAYSPRMNGKSSRLRGEIPR